MGSYAQDTSVPVIKSMIELESLFDRYGAGQILIGKSKDEPIRQFFAFRIQGQFFRLEIPMPIPSDFRRTKNGQARSPKQCEASADKETRRRWRVMVLIVKALLEGVDCGVFRSVKDALQPFVQLPDGQTLRDHLSPAIEEMYRTGSLPPLLPGPTAEKS